MREHMGLYRGKRIDNGEWVEGAYHKHDTVKACFTTDDPKPKHLIINDGFCDWGLEPPIVGYEVDPDTIGECTGLKDKNGKKIFEGDIVKLDEQLFKVIYECANFGLGSNKEINYNPIINKSKEAGSMDFWGCYCDNFVSLFELYWNFNDDENILNEIEVIGDVYDNPELLKGE